MSFEDKCEWCGNYDANTFENETQVTAEKFCSKKCFHEYDNARNITWYNKILKADRELLGVTFATAFDGEVYALANFKSVSLSDVSFEQKTALIYTHQILGKRLHIGDNITIKAFNSVKYKTRCIVDHIESTPNSSHIIEFIKNCPNCNSNLNFGAIKYDDGSGSDVEVFYCPKSRINQCFSPDEITNSKKSNTVSSSSSDWYSKWKWWIWAIVLVAIGKACGG